MYTGVQSSLQGGVQRTDSLVILEQSSSGVAKFWLHGQSWAPRWKDGSEYCRAVAFPLALGLGQRAGMLYSTRAVLEMKALTS